MRNAVRYGGIIAGLAPVGLKHKLLRVGLGKQAVANEIFKNKCRIDHR